MVDNGVEEEAHPLMAAIWDEMPDVGAHKYWEDERFTGKFNVTQYMLDMAFWLEKLREFYHDWIADQKEELDGKITKLEAIKKHYDNRPKVVHAPLWFMKLGKILEAKK